MHWAAKYVGIPYAVNGRDWNGVDCWGLLWLVYREEFGIDLPHLLGISVLKLRSLDHIRSKHSARDWVVLAQPRDGCAIGMSQSSVLHHVGIWIDADGGKILHGWNGQAVIADTKKMLALRGLKVLNFYQHKTWPGLLRPQTPSSLSD